MTIKFDNLKICGVDSTKIAVSIIVFSSAIAIILLLILPFCHFCYKTSPGFWSNFIGSCIAIANALLLYATLRSQNESIVNTKEAHRQERFETTFFNLLDYQRRLTEEIVINYEYVDDNLNTSSQEVKGREAFSYANNEIRQISNSLTSGISSTYNYDDIIPEWEKLKEELVGEDTNGYISEYGIAKLKEFRNKAIIKHHNKVYSICDEDRQNYPSNSTIPYKLFMQKWKPSFERYIRNLECLLQHMCEEHQLHGKWRQKYIKFLQSQMTRDELQLIETHAQSFPDFNMLLVKTHLTEIVTNNKIQL